MHAPRIGPNRTGRMSSRSPLTAALGALASTSGVATRKRVAAPATISAAMTVATSLNMYAPCIFFSGWEQKLTKLNEFSIVRREESGTIRDRKPILRFRSTVGGGIPVANRG